MVLGGQKNGQTSFKKMLSKDCVFTDIGDAFSFFSKCKCDENMFWCQKKHKTYSIVLMYISFCGATYNILYYNDEAVLYCVLEEYTSLLLRLLTNEHTAGLIRTFYSE